MPLETFIAGPYTGAYGNPGSGVSTGITENGYELQHEVAYQDIGPSDVYGETVLDSVYRGGNVFIQFESKAYKTGSILTIWPFGLGLLGTPGKMAMATSLATAMVLTAVSGTPAAATPATLTARYALLAQNFSPRLLFDSRLRTVPVRMRVYPYDAGSSVITWVTTT